MRISERILNILEDRREMTLSELIKELKEHPGVIKLVIKRLQKEGKIIIEKKKFPHKPKKYELIIKAI